MPIRMLREFLDAHNVKYVTMTHSPAYTAPELAHSVHVPGKSLAKTVMVKLDGEMAMAVLPSSHQVDFGLLRRAAGVERAELANESEFRDRFAGCEIGAMPPFGNLYGMRVFVADSLVDADEIVFNAGYHTEVMRLAFADFERLVRPTVLRFATLAA